jgi:hypothetical protein
MCGVARGLRVLRARGDGIADHRDRRRSWKLCDSQRDAARVPAW